MATPDGERWRLFVAIVLPDAWKQYLARVASDLERRVPGYTRWVAPELMHLTLVFLGEQPRATLPTIQAAVAEAAGRNQPFPLRLGRASSFGRPPRVLWVAAEAPRGALGGLHATLTAALAARGLPFDAKPLAPHITLGRARRDAQPEAGRALAALLAGLKLPPLPEPILIDAITLMRSELSPRGPQYTPVVKASLAAFRSSRSHGSDAVDE